MKTSKLILRIVLCLCMYHTSFICAQNGDQILDGIGETGLIARYTLEDNAKDWSRNNLHGKIQGSNFEFVADSLFEKVLFLKGNSYISLPGRTISGEESLSLSCWIYLCSSENKQIICNFGKSNKSCLLIAQEDINTQKNDLVQITDESSNYVTKSHSIKTKKWTHLVVVFNAPHRTLSTYLDGELVGQTQNINIDLEQLFDSETNNNKLYIGKTIGSETACLNAKMHDFRIYRISLTEKSIGTIYNNSLHKGEIETSTQEPTTDDLKVFSPSTPQLYNAYLDNVPDIYVTTTVGNLPRLPRYVKGNYQDDFKGPDVIVLWPAPTDNKEVSKTGTYTVTGYVSGTNIHPKAIVTVEEKETPTPERNIGTFELDQVVLNNDCYDQKTKFIENRDKFLSVLANTNPDNFLYMFRNAFGQKQPQGAKQLGVWDSQECKLRGHATGHYLTALAQAYASTGYDTDLQKIFADKMTYVVNTLYDLSQMSGKPKTADGECVSDPMAIPFGPGKSNYNSDLSEEGIRTDYWNWGTGYISAYPPDQFIMLEQGAKYGGDDTKVWAPYYTLHKILAGLLDVYEITGNEKALEIVIGMGDWVTARISQLNTTTLTIMWNSYIAGEYGGMNEAMSRLYRLTKEERYLEIAHDFDNIRIFFGDNEHSGGLAKNVDLFRGLHANQHIPQIMGALEVYRNSNDPDYYHIAENFWHMATNAYMYSIGGVAGARNPTNAECFTKEPSTLYRNGFSSGGQNETCATYNMLKITRYLFQFNQDADLMDYYERGLYNHILASVAKNSPANTYHVPLRAASIKQFTNGDMSGFSCCNGTALESNTKLQNTIYLRSRDNQSLYVNLYIPSTLSWTERNITVTQTTAYPKEDHTLLTISGKGKFDLKVRVPHWAKQGFFVKINGEEIAVDAKPGTYLSINRKWKDGDTVELKMPFHFYLEPVMDQENVASLFYGPILLAAQESKPLSQWRKVTFNADDISKSITCDHRKLEFTIDGVLYKPFYDSYGRYSVYLDVTLQ